MDSSTNDGAPVFFRDVLEVGTGGTGMRATTDGTIRDDIIGGDLSHEKGITGRNVIVKLKREEVIRGGVRIRGSGIVDGMEGIDVKLPEESGGSDGAVGATLRGARAIGPAAIGALSLRALKSRATAIIKVAFKGGGKRVNLEAVSTGRDVLLLLIAREEVVVFDAVLNEVGDNLWVREVGFCIEEDLANQEIVLKFKKEVRDGLGALLPGVVAAENLALLNARVSPTEDVEQTLVAIGGMRHGVGVHAGRGNDILVAKGAENGSVPRGIAHLEM